MGLMMLQTVKHWVFRDPFDVAVSKAAAEGKKNFLVVWNRGLGDIPLTFYAATKRIRNYVPEAKITFLTRPDLEEGFVMLGGVEILVNPNIRRKQEFVLDDALAQVGHHLSDFDHVFEELDTDRWFKWQLGKLTPKLIWRDEWDSLSERFGLGTYRPLIGVHVQTETVYRRYDKNWSLDCWRVFFTRATRELNAHIVLFGFQPIPQFEGEGIIDLRGKTTLIEMMAIIKNCCTHLVAPDSGVLCMTYYLDVDAPLAVISLWGDPRYGVLRQRVASPNPQLRHYPLIGWKRKIAKIPVEAVLDCIRSEGLPCVARRF